MDISIYFPLSMRDVRPGRKYRQGSCSEVKKVITSFFVSGSIQSTACCIMAAPDSLLLIFVAGVRISPDPSHAVVQRLPGAGHTYGSDGSHQMNGMILSNHVAWRSGIQNGIKFILRIRLRHGDILSNIASGAGDPAFLVTWSSSFPIDAGHHVGPV